MSIGPLQLLIIAFLVLVVFGTSRLRNVGGDLGAFVRSFRKGLTDDESAQKLEADPPPAADTRKAAEKDQVG